jgi:SNF2 family DNA or RNA helicase
VVCLQDGYESGKSKVAMFKGTLKPYQTEPVETFLERGNLLVAYEMGLGKTVIGIAAAERLMAEGKISCCVIVCPASIKFQWAERIEQFTDAGFCVIDGTVKQREILYQSILKKFPRYIIMGYDNVINDASFVRKIRPEMVILDEATAIKTFRAKRTKQIKKMLKPKYRLALTGTPVENKPDELFSIMQWVDEEVLGRYDLFDKAYISRSHFGWVVGYKNLPVLKKKLGPALSRKSRHDPEVSKYLPSVDEDEWYADMSPEIKKVYKKISGDLLIELDSISPGAGFELHDYYSGADESTPSGKVMAIHTAMEMFLDHPDLVIMSAQNGALYANDLWQDGYLDNILTSPKLELLKEKVNEILEFPENKILIYTRYRGMLNILEDELNAESVKFHGGKNSADKQSAVAKFTNDPLCRVFLSSHAGAYGMDMSMANYLINYDLPWSAGKADQINGRHVRVSSEFGQVFVRNVVFRDSIEARKLRMLDRKRRIAGAILDGTGQDEFGRVETDKDTLTDHCREITGT